MKKVVFAFVFILSLLSISILKVTNKAQAGNTCKDNCIRSNGHCTWRDSGGTIYVCPSWYTEKEQQE